MAGDPQCDRISLNLYNEKAFVVADGQTQATPILDLIFLVLLWPLQREEEKKREGMQISKKGHRTFEPRNTLSPVQCGNVSRRADLKL